jgi:hypothetical protein
VELAVLPVTPKLAPVAEEASPNTPVPVALGVIASSLAVGAVVPRPTFPLAVWYSFEFPRAVVLVHSGM